MSRLEEIKNEYAKELGYNDWFVFINDVPIHLQEKHYNKTTIIYTTECCAASLEKAKKDLYNYWIFFEEGKQNLPDFTIKEENITKVFDTAYNAYGPQVKDLYYTCVSPEGSITNLENIILL